jgi:hypothetical protein
MDTLSHLLAWAGAWIDRLARAAPDTTACADLRDLGPLPARRLDGQERVAQVILPPY